MISLVFALSFFLRPVVGQIYSEAFWRINQVRRRDRWAYQSFLNPELYFSISLYFLSFVRMNWLYQDSDATLKGERTTDHFSKKWIFSQESTYIFSKRRQRKSFRRWLEIILSAGTYLYKQAKNLNLPKTTENCCQYEQLVDRHYHALQRAASAVWRRDRSRSHENNVRRRRSKRVRLCDFGYNKSRNRQLISAWLEATMLSEAERKFPCNHQMRLFFRRGAQKGRSFLQRIWWKVESWRTCDGCVLRCHAREDWAIDCWARLPTASCMQQIALPDEWIRYVGWSGTSKLSCDI